MSNKIMKKIERLEQRINELENVVLFLNKHGRNAIVISEPQKTPNSAYLPPKAVYIYNCKYKIVDLPYYSEEIEVLSRNENDFLLKMKIIDHPNYFYFKVDKFSGVFVDVTDIFLKEKGNE